MKNESKKDSNTKSIEKLLIIALVIAVISPWVLTREAIFQILDLSGKGEIGDAIGGLTAPVINMVAAYLVFIAFREQKKANDIQLTSIAQEHKERVEDKTLKDEETLFTTTLSQLSVIDELYHQIPDIDKLNMYVHQSINVPSEEIKAKQELASALHKLTMLYVSSMTLIKICRKIKSIEITSALASRFLLTHNFHMMWYQIFFDSQSEKLEKILDVETTTKRICFNDQTIDSLHKMVEQNLSNS